MRSARSIASLPLSVRLPVLLLLTLIVVAAAGISFIYVIGQDMLQQRELEHNRDAVQDYASAISFYLRDARSLLDTTANSPAVADAPQPNLINPALHGIPDHADIRKRDSARRILQYSTVFQYIMFLQSDGSIYFIEPYNLQVKSSLNNLAFTAWYKKLISTRKTVLSDLYISPSTQEPTIVVATPVYDASGRLNGIWAGGLNLKELALIGVSDSSNTEMGHHYGYVTDGRGLVIAHQHNPNYVKDQIDFSSVPTVQAALAGEEGVMRYLNPVENEEGLGAYMPLPGTRWAIVHTVSTKAAFSLINDLTRDILLIVLVAIVLLVLFSLIILRQFTMPLSQLSEAAVKIGSGDLSQRITVKWKDEIGQLATKFNEMAASLADKEAQLRQYTTNLEQKVEERTAELARSLQELKQKSVDLERSNAELERFAYVASHDLQEPLRMVSSYTQLLERRYKDKLDADANDFINYAVDGAKRMQQLINDLLAYSRVGTRGKPFENTDCGAVFDAAIANLSVAIQESNAVVTHDPLPALMADEGQLVQLFQNLISNAIKFRDKRPPKVHVSAKLDGDKWMFSVQDNGIGIDPQYFDRVFVIFQRLQGNNYPGTGVGLSISKKVVERHGGRLWIDSQTGKGSTFYFTLPQITK